MSSSQYMEHRKKQIAIYDKKIAGRTAYPHKVLLYIPTHWWDDDDSMYLYDMIV